MKPIGIYIHVPFCKRKCAYCDFFSVCTLKTAEDYTLAVLKDMEKFRAKGIFADTLYLGGGTPTELPADSLCRIIQKAREIFEALNNSEGIEECNKKEALIDNKNTSAKDKISQAKTAVDTLRAALKGVDGAVDEYYNQRAGIIRKEEEEKIATQRREGLKP